MTPTPSNPERIGELSLRKAVEDFMYQYRRAYTRPSTDGIRTNAPMKDSVAALNAALAAQPTERETGDEADANLNAVLNYAGGFYGTAIAKGIPAQQAADAVAHIEKAARRLHALAKASSPSTIERATIKRCEDEIIRLTKKWGDPVGTEYDQGTNDHGNRLLGAIRALPLASEGERKPSEG